MKNPQNYGLEPLRMWVPMVPTTWALGLMRFVRGTSLPVIFPQLFDPHLLEFHWNPPWLPCRIFRGIFLGQNWGFVEVHQWSFFFFNESSSMDVKSPHFPSLGGLVTMFFFRERNSWSCFVGQSVAKFSLRFWVTQLAAWIQLHFHSIFCHQKSTTDPEV